MSVPEERRQVTSVLGHPVAGLAPILVLSAGWLLLALQIVPWIRDRFAHATLAGRVPGLHDVWPAPPQIVLLVLIAAGLLFFGAALMIIWVRSARGFGPLSDRLLSRSESLAGIALLACGVLTAAVLAPGTPTFLDTKTHVVRGCLWFEYLRAGKFPIWTDLWAGGFPADQHYPPLSHIFQALLMLTRLNAYTATKVLVWFARISGGVGFALLCARVHRDARAGFLGGLIYALSPIFHGLWIWQGWLSGVVMLGILPWAFLSGERLATGTGGIRAGAALALTIGALVLAHTLPARPALIVLLAFMLLRAVPTMASRGARAPSIVGILIGWIGGMILTACFLVPILRESSFVNGGFPIHAGVGFRLPGAREIMDALRWTKMGKEYMGITVAALAIVGMAIAIRDRKSGGRAMGPIPLAILIVLPWFFARSSPRTLIPILFGTMLAAAGAVRRDPSGRRRFGRGIVYPLATLLVVVDLAPLSLTTSYGEHAAWREGVYANLLGKIEGGRLLELPTDAQGKPTPSIWRYPERLAMPSLGCPYSQGAPKGYVHACAAIDTVAHALARGVPLDPDLVRLLALHDVRYVLVTGRGGGLMPAGVANEGFVLDPAIPAYRVEDASAIAILEPGIPDGPDVPPGTFISDAGLPPATSRALARGALAWLRTARPRLIPEARSVVLPNRLQIDAPDVGAATLRIARNAYPATAVIVDGLKWPWRPAPLGGIEIDVNKGPHRIEVWGTEDRVRRGLRFVQWGVAALLFLVAIGPSRR